MVCLSLLLFSLATLTPALAASGITAVGAGFSAQLDTEPPSVAVHRAEFGDDASTPVKAAPPQPLRPEPPPAPRFVRRGFNYGQDLRYRPRTRQQSRVFDYKPYTRLKRRAYQPQAGMLLRRRYGGGGKQMRRAYQPKIDYGEGVRREQRRYRFADE